jgi:uncharacterized protein YbjT (DUF2867 family)
MGTCLLGSEEESHFGRQTEFKAEEVIMTTQVKPNMKIVVIGGTGLIGSKVVRNLSERGYEVVAASPDSGVNTLTGEGLIEVLDSTSVVVDVSNSPSFEDAAVMEFFQTSTRNLLNAEAAAGVGHHVVLSIVGSDRLPDSGYMRAKVAQEKLIKDSSVPYSIVRATQFFEFVDRIADSFTESNIVRVPSVAFQPLAAEDVARFVTNVAIEPPLNGTVEVAGPERFRFDELIRQGLVASKDPREVIADSNARYFGTELIDDSLVPSGDALHGETRFEDWLSRSAQPTSVAASKGAAGIQR